MNEEETTTSVVNTTDTQENETEQKNVATPQNEANQENAERKSLAKAEGEEKGEQSTPTTIEDKPTVDSPVTTANKSAEPKTDPATPAKPDPTQTTEQHKKLADVVPTSLVWISGMVGSHQIDCAGPIELPFALTKPEWPYTTVAPNPAYTNQVFDYDSGTWVPTDAKSQGQQLTDLGKKVEALREDSASHDKSADQTQKMGAQLMQTMLKVTNKLTTVENKLDTLLKDGDK